MTGDFLRQLSLIICALVLAANLPPAMAQTLRQQVGNTETLEAIQKERAEFWGQFNALGGQRTLQYVEHRMTTRRWQIDGIESRLAEIAGGTRALEAMRSEVDDKWVVSLSDMAEEAAEEAGEQVVGRELKKAGKAVAGKAVGWIGLIGDVVEYGGKKIIKELNVDQLEELIRQNRVTMSQALRLQSALLRDNNEDRDLLNDLRAAKQRYQDATRRLEEARSRQRPDEPEEIVDFCSFIADRKAQAACYGVWAKHCSGISSKEHEKRCYEVINAARAGAPTGGKFWNFCAHMRPDYKSVCYNFGSVVRRLCQMLPDSKERGECIRNVRRVPRSIAGQ